MASIAESSVGSLPQAKLAELQAEMLQARVLPEANSVADAPVGDGEDTNARTTKDSGNDEKSEQIERQDEIAESAHAYRTPISSPKTDAPKPPRLESARSAPPAEMEGMLGASPSQQMAVEEVPRPSSFNGFEGGDTQPLESQYYRDWKENEDLSKSAAHTTPKKDKVLLRVSPDGKVEHTYDTAATGQTPRTLREGDEGYVDLARQWLNDGGTQPEDNDNASELGESVNGDSQMDQPPAHEATFRKPALPTTPSLAGLKRKRSAEVPTSEPSAKKTPGFSQAFNFGGQANNVMTGTQLFEQTQANSSPMPDALRSDPAPTRPSPNLHNQWPVSSPTVMMSSPVHQRVPPSTAGEPRDTYHTFKESQERRARFEQDFGRRGSREFQDDDDDEENTQERRITRQLQKRALSENAVHTLKSVSADSRCPSRPATSSSPRKAVTIDLRTPATAKKATDYEDISDDGLLNEDDAIEGETAEGDDDQDLPEAGAEDDDQHSQNDVYDELGERVLRSQGLDPDEDEEDDGRDVEQDDEQDIGQADQQAAPQVTLVQGSSQQDRNHFHRKSQNATQHSAIADSQPLPSERQQASAPANDTAGSPSCSYVPGSQYAGKTSQDQAAMLVRTTTGAMGPPIVSASKSQDAGQQVVPSSPPIAANDSSVDYTNEASLERQKMLEDYQHDRSEVEQIEQEIPESDLPGPETGSSRPIIVEERPNTESNNAHFSSARSHLSGIGPSLSQNPPPPSPLKVFASQQSKVNSQSPRTKAGVRHFADIDGEPAAPTGSGEALDDVDAVMSDFISAEDQQVLEAVTSPARERPQKRRRAVGKPTIHSSSPVKQADGDLAAVTGAVEPEQSESAPERLATEQGEESHDVRSRALRNSPSKANEQRAASPPFELTPESVKQREQAGAKAASQLLTKRSSRLAKPTQRATYARKSSSKLQQEVAAQDQDAPTEKHVRTKRPSKTKGAKTTSDNSEEAATAAVAEEPENEETVIESNKQGEQGAEDEDQVEDQQCPKGATDVVAPHRVFALFRGTLSMFYPATWMGASPRGGHRIKFDDNTVTTVEPHLVARMELALGDQIKIDYPGMKNKVWVVKGFGPALPAEKTKEVLTDIHGHETVKVQAKSTRSSVSGPSGVAQSEGEIFNMAIEIIYLPYSIWSNFAKREFQPGGGPAQATRLETPSTGAQTPVNADTPGSRSRRATASTAQAIDKRDSFLRGEPAPGVRTPSAGVFQGMAFAVSYGQNEGEKVNVTRLIQRNGGIILDDGFESLFDAPALDELEEPTSPGKKSAKKAQPVSPATPPGLRLDAQHKDLGFVALIADKHSRRAKYIQALALGIPTLSGRWVMDSLDTSKNVGLSGANAAPLPWTKYLLAAGESAYLNGAIRSRDIPSYAIRTAKLSDTVANRPLLLGGEGVLIVASKKSKAIWERRKAFAFLTLALGAGHVKRVSDLQEAKVLVADDAEKWKFVYVDGSVADASAVLLGKVGFGGGGGKKRKREDPSRPAAVPKGDAKAMSASDGRVRIVNDEFVVQSLILGALVD